MAESEHEIPGVFDLERIRTLIELMREHDIAEVDLREGEQRIRLARPSATPLPTAYAVPQYAPPGPPASPANPSPAPSGGAASAAADGENIVYIRSPMVGTFYSRANPNAAPFVKVGDHVEAETTVCIVEAMKMFNEIPAEVRGRIVAVHVQTHSGGQSRGNRSANYSGLS
jgi:acetyl-CoA carboxylase biotin carboxyl carrier protein